VPRTGIHSLPFALRQLRKLPAVASRYHPSNRTAPYSAAISPSEATAFRMREARAGGGLPIKQD